MVASDPLGAVADYYARRLAEHGATARGVDWNATESQELRFAQLAKAIDAASRFTLNDYGCGYGALASFLDARGYEFVYTGYDIAPEMVSQARAELARRPHTEVVSRDDELDPADYTVASGIFNVRLDASDADWERHVSRTLDRLAELSMRAFAFNMLTSYSDPERMRDHLWYADPREVFDRCKRRYSRHVALLHDYGLYEFTTIVRL